MNEDIIASELYRSFNQDNVILFAGSESIKNGELTDAICRLPWSCVITTLKNDDFGTAFVNGRNPHKYISLTDLPINLFNRDELPVIQVWGSETEMPQGIEDIDELLHSSFLKKQGEKILNRVMSRMDIRSRMVVIGYNPDSDKDISLDTFVLSCQEIKGGTVTFFNSCAEENSFLKGFAQKNNFLWINEKIVNALADISNDYDLQDNKSDTNLFFKGLKPAFIKKSILSRSRNFVQLLTEEKIKEIRPLGSIQQSRWFYNFLNNSSDTPQWYGWVPFLSISFIKELIFFKVFLSCVCQYR